MHLASAHVPQQAIFTPCFPDSLRKYLHNYFLQPDFTIFDPVTGADLLQ